jgi:uncharacterized protein (TIGR00730 family)
MIKSVCVYCGSSFGKDPVYRREAASLGRALAEKGITLVYGGGKVGLMGVIADTVMENGGCVTGVIPRFMDAKELSNPSVTRLVTVDTMHERKAKMAELSDGFIAMPGGVGTFEEIFEAVTWTQLGIHLKPCAFYNIKGYYDLLREFVIHAATQGFVRPSFADALIFSDNPREIIQNLAAFNLPEHDKVAEALKELSSAAPGASEAPKSSDS